MVKFTPEVMRDRFWALIDEKEALVEELSPLAKHRDVLRDALRGPLMEFKQAKKACNVVSRPRMGVIDTEMAALARALGNKVGPRPAS